MRQLPPLRHRQCAALIDDPADAKSYSGLRRPTTLLGTKRCSRAAKYAIGPLALCTTHARLAREGFVAEDGAVADRNAIRESRRYKVGGLYSWHRHYPE